MHRIARWDRESSKTWFSSAVEGKKSSLRLIKYLCACSFIGARYKTSRGARHIEGNLTIVENKRLRFMFYEIVHLLSWIELNLFADMGLELTLTTIVCCCADRVWLLALFGFISLVVIFNWLHISMSGHFDSCHSIISCLLHRLTNRIPTAIICQPESWSGVPSTIDFIMLLILLIAMGVFLYYAYDVEFLTHVRYKGPFPRVSGERRIKNSLKIAKGHLSSSVENIFGMKNYIIPISDTCGLKIRFKNFYL